MVFYRLFSHFLTIYLSTTSVSLTVCISIVFFFSFEYSDSFDHCAACWFPLNNLYYSQIERIAM